MVDGCVMKAAISWAANSVTNPGEQKRFSQRQPSNSSLNPDHECGEETEKSTERCENTEKPKNTEEKCLKKLAGKTGKIWEKMGKIGKMEILENGKCVKNEKFQRRSSRRILSTDFYH